MSVVDVARVEGDGSNSRVGSSNGKRASDSRKADADADREVLDKEDACVLPEVNRDDDDGERLALGRYAHNCTSRLSRFSIPCTH